MKTYFTFLLLHYPSFILIYYNNFKVLTTPTASASAESAKCERSEDGFEFNLDFKRYNYRIYDQILNKYIKDRM